MIRFITSIGIFILIFFATPAGAQQASQFTLFTLNPFNYNPAYAGMEESLSATGVYRKQWVGLTGSPEIQSFTAHVPLHFLNGGVGIGVESAKLGAEQNNRFFIAYNYHMSVGREARLSIGLAGGVFQKSLDGSKLRTPEGDYEGLSINHNDLILPIGTQSEIVPQVDFGVYFNSLYFDVGLSAGNVHEPVVGLTNEDNGITSIIVSRVYYLFARYRYSLTSNLVLSPAVLVKSDAIQTQTDIQIIATYNENLFFGAGLRGYNKNSFDAVNLLGGIKLNRNFSIAYAFDLTLSPLKQVSQGSHEFVLNYNLGKPIGVGKLPKIINNPRFY